MNLAKISIKGLNKKLNWILDSVNLSIDLLEWLPKRKIYRVLKRAFKFLEIDSYSKKELKEISALLYRGELSNKEKIFIAKVIFDFKEKLVEKQNEYLNTYDEPFIGLFFDKKQILRC